MSRTSEEAKELIRWALQTKIRIITILSSDDHYIVIKNDQQRSWSGDYFKLMTAIISPLSLQLTSGCHMMIILFTYDDHHSVITIHLSWPHLIKSRRLLLVEPSERMSASECLQHPWLSGADIYIGDPVEAFRDELYKYILLDIHRWCWRSLWSIIGTYLWRIFYENLWKYFSDVLHELETTWMRRCLARRRWLLMKMLWLSGHWRLKMVWGSGRWQFAKWIY